MQITLQGGKVRQVLSHDGFVTLRAAAARAKIALPYVEAMVEHGMIDVRDLGPLGKQVRVDQVIEVLSKATKRATAGPLAAAAS